MNRSQLLHLELEKKVSHFRQENGYTETESIQLPGLLLKLNVITLFKPLSPSLAGMAIKAGEERFMLINQEHILGKQHFTIGHELYHLFVQENFTSQRCITGLFDKHTDPEEQKADIFSAILLMPRTGIIGLIPEKELFKKGLISVETLFKIQHYYNVSMKAVIHRLYQLDIVDKSYFDTYATGIKNKAKILGYSTALYERGNDEKVIGDYGTLAKQLFETHKVSESHYLELMGAINVDPLAPPVEDEDE